MAEARQGQGHLLNALNAAVERAAGHRERIICMGIALVGWSALHGATMLVLDGVLDNTAVAARRKPREIARLVLESLLTGILNTAKGEM